MVDPVVLTGQHPVAEKLHDRRKIGLLVEFLVVGGNGVAAQRGGHRGDRDIEPGPLQVGRVGGDDFPPVRVEVGLGGDDRCDRTDFERLTDVGQFGLGELLAGVTHHQHGVGLG
jgi:hypothetical protein